MAKWYSLDVRGDKEKEQAYDALLEGVPDHLREFLTRWLRGALWNDFDRGLDASRLMELGLSLRLPVTWPHGVDGAFDSFLEFTDQKPEDLLSAIDYALQHWPVGEIAAELDRALEQGGSAWKVHWDGSNYRLVRRVDESVQAAEDNTIKKSGRAGEHLRKALIAIYGRNPDPSTGYRESVRAVEVASIEVICPNEKNPTLGSVIRSLNHDLKGAKRFKLILGTDRKVEPTDVLRSMAELLWSNQIDRHGTIDDKVPLTVSLPEAEAAFHLACTLVHWFTTGKVTKTQ
jgi:hypothetical protein